MNEEIRKRILIFVMLFSTLFIIVILRIAHIQIFKGDELVQDSLNRRLYTQVLSPKRGEIVDRNNVEIVGNRKSYNVYAVPVEFQEALDKGDANLSKASKELGKILGIKSETIEENLMKEKSYYRLLKKDIDKKTLDKLKKTEIAGIGIETTTVRNYTQDQMLANLIGFVGSDGKGLEGLESTYNDTLTGKSGLLIVERDRKGNKIPSKQHQYKEAIQGNSLQLTIDSKVQYIIEDELKKLAESSINPTSAYVIVQDVNTGEILGLGNHPTYKPQDGGNADISTRKNGAVQFNFEPGSIFKLITLSSGLETGVIKKDTIIEDHSGYIAVANHRIKNWNKAAGGSLTLHRAAKESNNVAMVKIGQKLGRETFYDYIHKFGFGSKTNIGLYGEEQGLVKDVKTVSSLDLATNTIGQSIMVTPIQMVNAVSAIANGGNLMQPYIVKSTLSSDGEVIKENEPTVVRRVISEETSKTLLEIMRYVVTEGGAPAANIEGFDIGGKTGTAQKVGENGGGYAEGKYVTSFVGVAPSKNPKYAISVIVNEPKGFPYYGSTTATPTGANILKRIMLTNKDVSESSIKDAAKSTEVKDDEANSEN